MTAVTFPSFDTVATLSSDDIHVTDLSVAFSGPTVALSSTVSPSLRFAVVLSSVIVVAATFCGVGCGSGSGVGCGFSASDTLISHVAVTFLPYAALAVIVTSPALTAVTVPSSATVAIFSSDEDQITTLLLHFQVLLLLKD